MRRPLVVFALVAIATMSLVAPAAAQYGGGVRDRTGQVTPRLASAGETVTFTSNAVFAPGSQVDVVLVRARQRATGTVVGPDVATTSSGAVSYAFQVPAGTSRGIYIVYADGTSAGGGSLRVVAILVVLPSSAQATATGSSGGGADGRSGTAATPSSAPAVVPPADVQAIQQPAEVESVLFDEARRTRSPVVLDGERLLVAPGLEPAEAGSGAPESRATAGGPVAAAVVAIGFAGIGLLALRQRRHRAR